MKEIDKERTDNQKIVKVPVHIKDEKYPYLDTKELNLTGIGSRVRGRIVYLTGKLVSNEENEKFIEFEMLSSIALKLSNAKMVKTEKGTLVIKYEENYTLYLIEIPSGFRGSVSVEVKSGECYRSEVLRSPAGSLGEVAHIWCNGNAELQYKIGGRTRTAGYGDLVNLFGENLSGKILIKDGKVEVIYDEELDNLLS